MCSVTSPLRHATPLSPCGSGRQAVRYRAESRDDGRDRALAGCVPPKVNAAERRDRGEANTTGQQSGVTGMAVLSDFVAPNRTSGRPRESERRPDRARAPSSVSPRCARPSTASWSTRDWKADARGGGGRARSRRRFSAVAPRGRRHPEAESAGCGPEVTGFRVGYEPQPRAVRPGIGAERIAPVQLVEPAAVGQSHRADNGPSLIVLAVVLECLTVVALPALCDETYGILDAIAIFALGCVNPDPPAVAARPPRSVLDRLPAVEESPRPRLANAERRLRRRGRRRAHGTLASFWRVWACRSSTHEARGEVRLLPT